MKGLGGFYRRTLAERWEALLRHEVLTAGDVETLREGAALLSVPQADRMVENVVGVFGLPLALGLNLRVDGRDVVVPMVVEEPSIVAAISSAAKVVAEAGGFATESGERLLVGQVQLLAPADPAAAAAALNAAQDELLTWCNARVPRLVARGGGVRELHARVLALGARGGTCVVVHLVVDTCDAMGANVVNTLCEQVAPELARRADAQEGLRILSNLTERCLVRAAVRLPVSALASGGRSGEAVRDGVACASALADACVHRAVTHNKGIMNGIDAVALATGNDWRAIEANAHAWAGRGMGYRPLSRWDVDAEGALCGSIELPLKVGTVGGNFLVNPGVGLAQRALGSLDADGLARVMAACGLAQNFAALRALSTEGIQAGHMALHARSVAASAGAPPHLYDAVVQRLLASGEVKLWKAEALVRELTDASPAPASAGGDPSGASAAGMEAVVLAGASEGLSPALPVLGTQAEASPAAGSAPALAEPVLPVSHDVSPASEATGRTLARGDVAAGEVGVVAAALAAASEPAPEADAVGKRVHDERVGVGEGAGKVLLLGEHAVVYGARALALPLPLATTVRARHGATPGVFVEVPAWNTRVQLRWDDAAPGLHRPLACILRSLGLGDAPLHLQVDARVPRAMGLGSSAALAVATVRALASLLRLSLTPERVLALAHAAEGVAHGKASGVDDTLATLAVPLLFRRGTPPQVTKLALPVPLHLVIGQTAEPSLTASTVARVAAASAARPALYRAIFDDVDRLVGTGLEALRAGDLATLGVVMNLNHGLLAALEVSTPALEHAVHVARSHGALGAKLTGGGGGGSMVALCAGDTSAVSRALSEAGFATLQACVPAALPAAGAPSALEVEHVFVP